MTPLEELGEAFDGHDVHAAAFNGRRGLMIAELRNARRWLPRPPADEDSRIAGKPGARMIGVATGLLFALGIGLLAVSFAAQYRYVDAQRHQHAASLVEAGALDVGMVIFALLALGLARAGLPAKTPRALVVVCAAGSGVMNYAAADVTSPRSVLAYCMPPLFLAVVVDQVVVTVRRHVLGMREGKSPLAVTGTVTLWLLRTVLDPAPTARGLRRMVLNATPLPAAKGKAAITATLAAESTRATNPRPGSKTSQFLDLVISEHGPLDQFPLADVSRTCAELAPKVGLDAGAARTALRKAALAAQDGGAE